ncbi:ABC transporter ATP-binding protein [Paraglaciecola sp. 2405UD69-4]|uniref:ABC transporter ATP-binding protein n=1 Tax=Paraglaciecola sp. 2405UD69-4 TaxID=3391836 RepID=UPI0039C8C20F
MSALISISGLNKAYGKKQVLKNINLTVEPGQIIGLVGPNGAGKTTCLQALLGLTGYQGNIRVLGHNPAKDRAKMLESVAYISDVAVLPKWIKVSQLMSYMQGVHPKFDAEKAHTLLAKTNIPLNAKVKTLSKGMVTQLHLALILAVDAKVLVLDEPTLGLDILTRRQFYSHLLENFHNDHRCIVITTHQIEEIEHILTHVAFIRDGEIVIDESVEGVRCRFKLLTVANENIAAASALQPVFSNQLMGLTSMLFDDGDLNELQSLGEVSSPSLADVFVGIMSKEKGQ